MAALLERPDAPAWANVTECGDEAVPLPTDVLHSHPLAARDGMHRNPGPRVRIYPYQQLLILHGLERGPSGHGHYLELDQIIGDKCVVTVHGPINPTVPLEAALRETDNVRKRLEAGRLRPGSPHDGSGGRALITTLSSIYGMNIIVNGTTHVAQLFVVLTVMAVMPALPLAWPSVAAGDERPANGPSTWRNQFDGRSFCGPR